jgi:hypothetical protein
MPLLPAQTLGSLLNIVDHCRQYRLFSYTVDEVIDKTPASLKDLGVFIMRMTLVEPLGRSHPGLICYAAEHAHIRKNHLYYCSQGCRRFSVHVRRQRGMVYYQRENRGFYAQLEMGQPENAS